MKHGVFRRFVFFGVLCLPRPSTPDGVATPESGNTKHSFRRLPNQERRDETQFFLTALARDDRRNTKQHKHTTFTRLVSAVLSAGEMRITSPLLRHLGMHRSRKVEALTTPDLRMLSLFLSLSFSLSHALSLSLSLFLSLQDVLGSTRHRPSCRNRHTPGCWMELSAWRDSR